MAVFCVWNKCNNRCVMCSNPLDFQMENPYKGYSLKQLKDRIGSLDVFDRKGNLIDDKICLTGGEPTIHPDFLKIVSFTRKRFPRSIIEMDSNGRRFFYPSFTKKLLSFKNINLCISLHGFDAETHDAVTRTPESFDQAIKGLENIFKYKELGLNEIELRIIITKITCKYVEKILKLIKDRFSEADRIVIVFMEMEGQAGDNFKMVGLTHTAFSKYIPGIAKWIPKFKDLRFYHFPLCTIDYSLWPHVWRTLPKSEVTFLPSCSNCSYKKYCLGIHKHYLKEVGSGEFKPITTKKIIVKEGENFHRPIIEIYKK